MDIVVSDTNIFIDLYLIGLLNEFFALPFHIHTVDFVINEITEEKQKRTITKFLTANRLFVKKHSIIELQELVKLNVSCKGNVSITDCSVWKYARTNNYTLLTGDKQLRNQAIMDGVTVAGLIFIFDQLVKCNIITPLIAAEKLEKLLQNNKRLPKREIEERLLKWKK